MISGKDKGKTGKVERSFPEDSKILIAGINMHKRHERPRKSGEKGQIIEKPHPIHVSNVMIVDPKSGKGTRLGAKMVGEKKVRIAKKSGAEV